MPRPSPDDPAQRLIALACTVLDAPVGLLSLHGDDRTMFLLVFTFIAWRLNAAYWKDVK